MKRAVRLIGLLALCLAAALAGIAPASAEPRVNYVALGDSFSAGTNARMSMCTSVTNEAMMTIKDGSRTC